MKRLLAAPGAVRAASVSTAKLLNPSCNKRAESMRSGVKFCRRESLEV